jgi:hypothetical protein
MNQGKGDDHFGLRFCCLSHHGTLSTIPSDSAFFLVEPF